MVKIKQKEKTPMFCWAIVAEVSEAECLCVQLPWAMLRDVEF